ncbi:MAG TPA: septal ring lytic transglycosylase RlpA family protein, partial [Rubricoccaceae bacterium]
MSRLFLLAALAACLAAPASAQSADRITPGGRRAEARRGVASFYATSLHGRRTASGERYDRGAYTAAHRTLRFGTVLRVTNERNGRVL